MRLHQALAAALLGTGLLSGCAREDRLPNAATIAQQYGLSGAVAETITTSDGELKGTLVPVTMADGRAAAGGVGGLVYDLITRRRD